MALIAFAAIALIVRGQGPLTAGISGGLIGLSWHADLPLSLTSWGPSLALIPWLSNSVTLALVSSAAAQLEKRIALPGRVFLLPILWVAGVALSQELLTIPVALSPLFAISSPSVLTLGQVWGFYGNEFILVLCASMAAQAYISNSAIAYLPAVIFAIVIIIAIDALERSFQETSNLDIYGIQPSVSYNEARESAWSLYRQNRIENRLLQLTDSASKRDDPGLIVWPEGASNYPIEGVRSRSEKIYSMANQSESELFVTGYEYSQSGSKRNALLHFTSTGIENRVFKSLLAPIAEGNLEPGEPSVIQAMGVKIGIAICFEALFDKHYRALLEGNPEAIFVLTDDSSMNSGYMPETHAAYAIAFSATHAIPVFFLNNSGISLLTNGLGEVKHIDPAGDIATIYSWSISLADETINWDRNLIFWCMYLTCCAMVIICYSGKRERSLTQPGAPCHSALGLTSILLIIAAGASFPYLANTGNIATVVDSIRGRFHQLVFPDQLSPLYKQSSESSCGAAALAFLLTRMGDPVFEHDILNAYPLPRNAGFNLQELAEITRNQGFTAVGISGSWQDLPSRGDSPVLAHMDGSHFVVVLKRHGRMLDYFDPSLGSIVTTERDEFIARWGGNMLHVSYPVRG